MADSIEEVGKRIEVLRVDAATSPPRFVDAATSTAPSFLDVNNHVRQRLGLGRLWMPSRLVGRDLTALRGLRMRSRSLSDDNLTRGRQRPITLAQVWHSDTDEPPSVLRKLRLPNKARKYVDRSHFDLTACIRTLFTVVLLTLMTCVAAFTIHMLVISSDRHRKTTMKSSSSIGQVDFCDPSVTLDVKSLSVALRTKVFGQDLALDTVMRRLADHFSWNISGQVSVGTADIAEPTVLVFHGGTGTGKTRTAHILADHFTRGGMKVHWYISDLDRPSKHLLNWVASRWTSSNYPTCTALFVLDDFDMILDADQLEAVISYWKTRTFPAGAAIRPIFVVSFSKGAEFLENELLEHLMNDGVREDFVADVVQWQCQLGAYQVTYVPFLPIQREQLENCVRDFLQGSDGHAQPISDEVMASVIENTNFVPERFPVFSKSGCKRLQIL